jgi:hypothetical protein
MIGSVSRQLQAFIVVMTGLTLASCSSMPSMPSFGGFGGSDQPPPPAPSGPPARPSITPEDIVGRWGMAAFHKPEDRPRTEANARGQCKQPYVINRSSTGVAMLGHDSPQVQDMTIKASQEGKTYVGPGADPGGADDREVVSFDGRVLVLRWIDPEVAGRYGTLVLVRCGAEGTTTRTSRSKK